MSETNKTTGRKKYAAHLDYTQKKCNGESPYGVMHRWFNSTKNMFEKSFPQYGIVFSYIKIFKIIFYQFFIEIRLKKNADKFPDTLEDARKGHFPKLSDFIAFCEWKPQLKNCLEGKKKDKSLKYPDGTSSVFQSTSSTNPENKKTDAGGSDSVPAIENTEEAISEPKPDNQDTTPAGTSHEIVNNDASEEIKTNPETEEKTQETTQVSIVNNTSINILSIENNSFEDISDEESETEKSEEQSGEESADSSEDINNELSEQNIQTPDKSTVASEPTIQIPDERENTVASIEEEEILQAVSNIPEVEPVNQLSIDPVVITEVSQLSNPDIIPNTMNNGAQEITSPPINPGPSTELVYGPVVNTEHIPDSTRSFYPPYSHQFDQSYYNQQMVKLMNKSIKENVNAYMKSLQNIPVASYPAINNIQSSEDPQSSNQKNNKKRELSVDEQQTQRKTQKTNVTAPIKTTFRIPKLGIEANPTTISKTTSKDQTLVKDKNQLIQNPKPIAKEKTGPVNEPKTLPKNKINKAKNQKTPFKDRDLREDTVRRLIQKKASETVEDFDDEQLERYIQELQKKKKKMSAQ
jgi:hypothetical protein